MSKHYLIGDPHWDHENIIKYSSRPFSTVEEMNRAIINNWNNVVNPEDTVYLVGDISMKRSSLSLLSELKGRKILIKGNHDVWKLKDYLPYFEDIRAYTVYDNVIISHIPIYKGPSERFKGNIHGHLHEKRVMIGDKIDPWYYNVSVEQINYTPMLLEVAIQNLKNQK